MKIRGLIGLGLVMVVGPLVGRLGRQSPGALAVNYDPATCRITNFESVVVAEVTEGSAVYLLVDTVSARGVYHQSVIVKDLAGCVQKTPVWVDEGRPGKGLPKRVAVEFAVANWQLAIEAKGKEWVERRLAMSDVGGGLRSLELYSEDLAAFERLEVRYPRYLKGLDQFGSWAEARAYYAKVLQELPLLGCQGEVQYKNHCYQGGNDGG